MKRVVLSTFLAALFVGCATTSPVIDGAEKAVFATGSGRVWELTETPTPLPVVRLVPGQEKRISLIGSAGPGEWLVEAATTETQIGAEFILESDAIIIRALPGSKGQSLAGVTLRQGTESRSVFFPLSIDPLPVIDFTFTPKGKVPKSVFLAGSFNGWSGNTDALVAGTDGVFRLSRAIEPGSHTYKLVVDGDWIADPSNPNVDSSGYGNSLLKVDGDAKQTFEWVYLGAGFPGSGPQGAFRAQLDRGAIDPATVTILRNNKRVPGDEFSIDHATGTIVLKSTAWDAENYLTILGTTTDGKRGVLTAAAAYTAVPRSPRDEVIYFALTDRFHDGDPSNNPPTPPPAPEVHPLTRYHGGDWAGLRSKIADGYFTRLGVTTIWISPPNENTMKVEQESVPPGRHFTSYHGYWPTSSTETNLAFGSMTELQDLVSTAHENGIAILLDFVSNHVHEDHPLYQADPTIAAPLKLPDGTMNIRLFDAQPFTTWFDTFLPTIDYEKRPDMIATQTDSAIYWMQTTGADGFRHDAVKHVPLPFWQDLTRKVRRQEVKNGRRAYQVGETISGFGTVAQFVGPDMLDGQFDFPVYFAVQGALARGTGRMTDLADALRGRVVNYPPSAIMSPLLGNHDVGRFMGYADGDFPKDMKENEVGWVKPPVVNDPLSFRKLRFTYAFLTAIDGPATLYYGDEIGMTGAQDPDNRRPMKWDSWTQDEQGTFDQIAALNGLRRESIALRRGNTVILQETEETLVLARISPEETIIAAFLRNRDKSITVELPSWFGTPAAYDPILGQATLTPGSVGFLSLAGTPWSYGFWRVKHQ
jgi:glycosidase